MSATGLKVFDSTIQTTNIWLDEIMKDLKWSDRHRAYHALRAVLHTLRNRLPVDDAAHLSAQLPMLVRGVFFEGWHPASTPVKERRLEQFVAHVSEAFALDTDADPEQVCRSVLKVLGKHVDTGAVEHLRKVLPEELHDLL
jgi:uncharacterized protein (DUF2267 family)